ERARGGRAVSGRPYPVGALTSNKGGVGKTTVAVNLAVLLRTLRPELPVLLIGLDDQDLIDRMFRLGEAAPASDIAQALRGGGLDAAIQLGRHDLHYVPTSAAGADLKREITPPTARADASQRSAARRLRPIHP